jgi:hypothetical protein
MTSHAVAEALDAAVRLGVRYGATAVALVGSQARMAASPESDVDLVVLLEDPGQLLFWDDWFATFGPGVALVRKSRFGALEERRLLRADGLVVEVCVGLPAWASVDPLDPGTAAVVAAGLRVLWDPQGLLSRLLYAVA